MNAMPRLLYLLQALPVKIPQTFLHAVCSTLNSYGGGNPHLGRALLLRPKLRGGIGFPDPGLYCTVVHLTRVVDWCRHGDLILWLVLKRDAAGAPLAGLPWAGKTQGTSLATHPLIGPTLAETARFFHLSSLNNFPTPMMPVVGHLGFIPGLTDLTFY